MYNIGIDLGGTKIAAGIVSDKFEIVKKASLPTGAKREQEEIAADMAKLCRILSEESGISLSEVNSIGIASSGIADNKDGKIVYSCNLPFDNFKIREYLANDTGIEKVYVANDANAAALGEAVAGACAGVSEAVMVTLRTGVGGGIIVNKKIVTGFNFAGAEIGHIVIEHNGYPCSCGRRGCWESYSSAPALVRMTKEKMKEAMDSSMWQYCGGDIDKADTRCAFTEMKKGDRAACEVTDKYISYLACGVTNMINIFQPEVLCIGGGLSGEGQWLIDRVAELVNGEQYARGMDIKTEIKTATLGNDAGIIGAAALWIEE